MGTGRKIGDGDPTDADSISDPTLAIVPVDDNGTAKNISISALLATAAEAQSTANAASSAAAAAQVTANSAVAAAAAAQSASNGAGSDAVTAQLTADAAAADAATAQALAALAAADRFSQTTGLLALDVFPYSFARKSAGAFVPADAAAQATTPTHVVVELGSDYVVPLLPGAIVKESDFPTLGGDNATADYDAATTYTAGDVLIVNGAKQIRKNGGNDGGTYNPDNWVPYIGHNFWLQDNGTIDPFNVGTLRIIAYRPVSDTSISVLPVEAGKTVELHGVQPSSIRSEPRVVASSVNLAEFLTTYDSYKAGCETPTTSIRDENSARLKDLFASQVGYRSSLTAVLPPNHFLPLGEELLISESVYTGLECLGTLIKAPGRTTGVRIRSLRSGDRAGKRFRLRVLAHSPQVDAATDFALFLPWRNDAATYDYAKRASSLSRGADRTPGGPNDDFVNALGETFFDTLATETDICVHVQGAAGLDEGALFIDLAGGAVIARKWEAVGAENAFITGCTFRCGNTGFSKVGDFVYSNATTGNQSWVNQNTWKLGGGALGPRYVAAGNLNDVSTYGLVTLGSNSHWSHDATKTPDHDPLTNYSEGDFVYKEDAASGHAVWIATGDSVGAFSTANFDPIACGNNSNNFEGTDYQEPRPNAGYESIRVLLGSNTSLLSASRPFRLEGDGSTGLVSIPWDWRPYESGYIAQNEVPFEVHGSVDLVDNRATQHNKAINTNISYPQFQEFWDSGNLIDMFYPDGAEKVRVKKSSGLIVASSFGNATHGESFFNWDRTVNANQRLRLDWEQGTMTSTGSQTKLRKFVRCPAGKNRVLRVTRRYGDGGTGGRIGIKPYATTTPSANEPGIIRGLGGRNLNQTGSGAGLQFIEGVNNATQIDIPISDSVQSFNIEFWAFRELNSIQLSLWSADDEALARIELPVSHVSYYEDGIVDAAPEKGRYVAGTTRQLTNGTIVRADVTGYAHSGEFPLNTVGGVVRGKHYRVGANVPTARVYEVVSGSPGQAFDTGANRPTHTDFSTQTVDGIDYKHIHTGLWISWEVLPGGGVDLTALADDYVIGWANGPAGISRLDADTVELDGNLQIADRLTLTAADGDSCYFELDTNDRLSLKGASRFYFDGGGHAWLGSRSLEGQSMAGIIPHSGTVGCSAGGFLTYPASSSDYAGHLRLLASAGVVWQRDGLNPQSLFVSNTHTDASNYERGGMWWDADALKIGTQDAGTGVARVVHVQNLPTSNPGPGILWNDNGSPAIGT